MNLALFVINGKKSVGKWIYYEFFFKKSVILGGNIETI